MSIINTKISASLEDYLEAIYQIIEEKNGVKAIEVSRKLGVGRSSVTEALKLLADKNLIIYNRYEAISLTKEGEKAAQSVVLRHSTLYAFFKDILGLSPEESNENACKVEHVISNDALTKFIEFIDFAKTSNCINTFKNK